MEVHTASGAPQGRNEIARGVTPWKESAERSEPCKGGIEKSFVDSQSQTLIATECPSLYPASISISFSVLNTEEP